MAKFKAWMRDLRIKLTSSSLHQSMTFGAEHLEGKQDFDIEVKGSKYMSYLKDQFTVRIKNLTYGEVLQLVNGKFYDIEIFAGYKTSGAQSIFKGSVIYMSYQQDDPTTNTIIILAGSKLIAKYGQSKMNMSLNSGINMYSAIKFLCKRAGITNANINEDFKYRILQDTVNAQDSIGSALQDFADQNGFIGNSEGTDNNVLTLLDPKKNNNRVIKLDESNLVLVSGYPKLDSDGLTFSTLPIFNFMPLDVIQLDPSLIDISVDSYQSSDFNKTMFLDKDNKYIIIQIDYDLTNRSQAYRLNITSKARSLYLKNGGTS